MNKTLISLAALLGFFETATTVSAKKVPTYKVKVGYLGTNKKPIALSKTLTYKTKTKRTLKAKSIPGYTPVKKKITFKPKKNLKLNFVYKIAKVKKVVAKASPTKSFILNIGPTDTPTEAAQWSSKIITYQIDPSIAESYQQNYQNAVNAWNNVGIIKLVLTTSDPDIYMTESNFDPALITQEAFACTTWYQSMKPLPDGFAAMTNARITMFGDKLTKYSATSSNCETQIATHEIGHALGLSHNLVDDSSVMYVPFWVQSTNKYSGIGPTDISTIQKLYGWIK